MNPVNRTIGLVIPGPIGYSETFFTSKIKGLEEAGFKVIVFCARNKEETGVFNYHYQWKLSSKSIIRAFEVFFGLLSLLKHPIRVRRYLRFARQSGQSPGEIIRNLYSNGHILSGPPLDALHFGFTTMGVGREIMGKVMNCRLSTSFRGFDVAIYPVKMDSDCYRSLWANLDRVHTISDDLLNLAYTHLELPAGLPVEKITPAIQTKDFGLTERVKFFAGKEIKMLSIGRFHWKKGQEYALLALKELKEAGVKFQYTLAGEGEDRERLFFVSHQLGLEKEVTFLGKVNHQDVPALMQQHDLYLQPSVQEGFGNAVLEAQAAGMLCIVSNAEGLAENVLHGKTGWVVPKRDTAALATQIKDVLAKPNSELMEISLSARKRVREEFDLKDQIASFVRFYS